MYAILNNRIENLQSFIETKTDINIKNNYRAKVLNVALYNSLQKIMDALLKNKCIKFLL